MNFKALITTLVLGSSSLASADTLVASGSVSVSLGSTYRAPAPVIVRDHRAADPCDTAPATAPVYQAPLHQAPLPTRTYYPQEQRGEWMNPQNTVFSSDEAQYTGWIGRAPVRQMTDRYGRPIRTTDRYGRPVRSRWYDEGRVSQTWFDLSEPTRIDRGRESFHIGADKGLFSAIGLQAVAGRSVIDEVKIEYVDAYGKIQWQTVFPRQQLDGRNQTLTIALAPGVRAVNNIMVYGSTDRGSAYKLIAQ